MTTAGRSARIRISVRRIGGVSVRRMGMGLMCPSWGLGWIVGFLRREGIEWRKVVC